mgnify:CR=1 FL=1
MRKPFFGEFTLTQGFGENPQNYNQFGLQGHNGLDYGLPMRTEVLAPHGGKIIEATLDPKGYGLYIKIENDKEGSVLAHFAEFRVGVGDIISEGQLIALSDTSGNSTGPHLHWGYYLFPRNRQNGYDGFINQLPLLDIMAVITQKELDIIRNRRDELYNLLQAETAKNTDLSTRFEKEKQKCQDLRETLDKQTQADADLGQQLLDVSHARDDYLNRLTSIKDALQAPSLELADILGVIDNLRKPTDEAVKNIVPVLEEMHENLPKNRLTIKEALILAWNLFMSKFK